MIFDQKSFNQPYKIDMDTFEIPYDRDRNYIIKDENYIPPYFSYRYKSIYEGVILEIHLVDHCNLNCACCNHLSPIAEPWYISKEELREYLTAAKNNIPTIRYIILIGGEPTLHPDLIELCKIAREIFPDPDYTDIHVFTNGKNLKNIEYINEEFNKIRVHMSVCYYPGQTTISMEDVQKLNSFDLNNTRAFMTQTIVDTSGSGNYVNNFFNCAKQQLPRLFLDGYKLFICPFHSQAKHYFKKADLEYPVCEQDYIDIRTINNDLDKLQEFIFTPKPFCKYCYPGGENLIWHKSFRDLKEFDTDFFFLFFEDYDRYEKIINTNKEAFLICSDNEKNPAYDIMTYPKASFKKFITRYNGKIDIIIPYYNLDKKQLNKLINSLKKQTIIKDCCIYFISDNSPNETLVYDTVSFREDIDCFSLKTPERSGPGAARQKGIDNSFNPYVLFLDADDYFVDENALEKIFNSIKDSEYLVSSFLMYPDTDDGNQIDILCDNPVGAKMNVIVNRDILNSVKFKPYYSAEDQLFLFQLRRVAGPDKWYDMPRLPKYNYIAYGLKDNNTNLTSEFQKYKEDIVSFSKIASQLIFLDELSEIFLQDYKNMLTDLMDVYKKQKKNDFFKVFIYYLGCYIYSLHPEIINEDNFVVDYLIDYINKTYYLTLKNKSIFNLIDMKNYIIQYIQEVYMNNMFTKNISKDVLEILNKIELE